MSQIIETRRADPGFLGVPTVSHIAPGLEVDIAILGVPEGDPYAGEPDPNDQAHAPRAIRTESSRLTMGEDHHDFDLGGPLLDGREIRIVDCGDVLRAPAERSGPHHRAEAAARALFATGAFVVTLGGDHGAPIPVFRALEAAAHRGAAADSDDDGVSLVHVDAHLDWRDEVGGVREGYSSPIRRASELAHIGRIVQVGLRAQGSARAEEVAAARAYGAELVTAYDVHAHGLGPVIDRLPPGGRYYLSIDADGLDPSVMPAVAGPAPGGLAFHHVRALIHALVARGRLLGMDVVEITPSRDLNGISSLTAGQLVANAIGTTVRAGYFCRGAG